MHNTKNVAFVVIITSILSSCNTDLEPINVGTDKCDQCNMTIIDDRYAAACKTPTGQTFKFDDLHCMMEYSNKVVANVTEYYVAIYNRPFEPLVSCDEAYFIKNEIFPSPMNSGYAAFIDENYAKSIADSLDTNVLRWLDIKKIEWKENTIK